MSELAKNLSITALMLVVETLAAKELYDINRTTENFEFLCEKRGKLETYIAELEKDNDAVSAGKVSVDVKRELTDAEIEELGAQEAERKEFCPNCEAETPCTHEAELFVCDICGEDFAKYIVLRNCTLPDVSTTQDVTTPEPPEGA